MTNEHSKGYEQVVDGRVHDALKWVAQEARALIMVGAIDARRDAKLRQALDQLAQAYQKAGY